MQILNSNEMNSSAPYSRWPPFKPLVHQKRYQKEQGGTAKSSLL